ncbi:MAG: hypothetical protein P1S46_09625 [bacterium]|nr:hypothetical protein [bacterium]MDT8396072.1 hypothetical protein [bacterium]
MASTESPSNYNKESLVEKGFTSGGRSDPTTRPGTPLPERMDRFRVNGSRGQ